MGTLGAGERGRRDAWSDGGCALSRLHLNLDALGTKKVDTGAPMIPATPVLPEDRLLPDHERMQQHADLARLFGGAALPLALLAQWTGAATTNAGRVHHPQAAVGFSTSLLGYQRAPHRAPKCSIGLERKI